MANETQIWNKILTTVLKMPGVKVDRVGFLRQKLRPYCNQARLQMLGSVRPYTLVSDSVVDKLALHSVNHHAALATAASTIAGLPGGLAMAATLPADITQYYYHMFVLSQKLAYLYGFPDMCDDDGELSDVACDMLTIFMGVMMGAPVADKGIAELSKAVAENAVTRLPRVALTKTALFPVASQVAKMIGMRLSKDSFAKGIGRFVPIAGGLFSGGLTLFTFRPGANRLRKRLKAQRHLFNDSDLAKVEYEEIKASFVKSDEAERSPEKVELAVIQAMINMAKINDTVSPEKYRMVEQRIARSALSGEEKLELLADIESEKSFDVDYELLAAVPEVAGETFSTLVEIAKTDETLTMAERIFLNMVAQKLGISQSEAEAAMQ